LGSEESSVGGTVQNIRSPLLESEDYTYHPGKYKALYQGYAQRQKCFYPQVLMIVSGRFKVWIPTSGSFLLALKVPTRSGEVFIGA
jgi:hypothetical protein